jgi:hypothetical protein
MKATVNRGDVIMVIKDFMETGIGRKNLNSLDISHDAIQFGIKSMRFILVLEELRVYKLKEKTIYTDDITEIIQERLRERFELEMGASL